MPRAFKAALAYVTRTSRASGENEWESINLNAMRLPSVVAAEYYLFFALAIDRVKMVAAAQFRLWVVNLPPESMRLEHRDPSLETASISCRPPDVSDTAFSFYT